MLKTNFLEHNKIWRDTKIIWGELPPNALHGCGRYCKSIKDLSSNKKRTLRWRSNRAAK